MATALTDPLRNETAIVRQCLKHKEVERKVDRNPCEPGHNRPCQAGPHEVAPEGSPRIPICEQHSGEHGEGRHRNLASSSTLLYAAPGPHADA